jgi:hypothetical protein
MSSSYRSNYGPQSREPLHERRRQPRAEDAATEAFIRKYMELAKVAMKEPPHGERTDVPVHAKRKVA